MLRELLLERKVLSESELQVPKPASREQILLAHTEQYHDDFQNGTTDPAMIRRLGLPWSRELYFRSVYSVGGAIESAYSALADGIAGNLAGGTHHAFSDSAEGFCVFNDLAIVSRLLLSKHIVRSIALVDLDVHQGNGNSSILGSDAGVFIFSMHGKNNYPYRKIPSTLDVELNDGTGDDEYIELLRDNLPAVFEFDPEIVLYIHGADPLKEDSLGRLSMTAEGLIERDRIVLSGCRSRGIPVSLALGGGYSKPITYTVNAYCNTYSVAKELYGI